jgi:hypothetical protein
MKTPFPGMDTYLERHWADMHARLIGYAADALQPQLAEDLIARMEESVYVEDDTETKIRRPDVRIVESPEPWQPEAVAVSTAVRDDVVELELLGDPIRQRSVLIYDAAGKRIVTAIEVLSPWNKTPGRPLEEYLRKREKYVNSETNLVEIDLVRTGDWTRMIGSYSLPAKYRTTYRVTVARPERSGLLLYPIPKDAKHHEFLHRVESPRGSHGNCFQPARCHCNPRAHDHADHRAY